VPPKAKVGQQHAGKKIKFDGVVTQLEHHYRRYRKQGTSNAGMDEYLKNVMVEYDCPECGGARLKRTRRLVTVDGRNLYEVGEMHMADLRRYLRGIKPTARQSDRERSCAKSRRGSSC
jgi:excinuclease ABC subunit A